MKRFFCTRTFFLWSTIAILSLLVCTSGCTTQVWNTSLEDAQALAKKKDQHILFFASDPLSADFKKTVLDSNDFLRAAKKHYTLLHIEYDTSAEFPPDLQKISLDYNIQFDKSLYILSYEGYILGIIPYTSTFVSGADVRDAILAFEKNPPPTLSLLQTIRKTDDPQKKVLLIDSFFEASDETIRRPLVPLCRSVLLLDKENTSGLLGKYELFLANNEAESLLQQKNVEAAANLFTDLCTNGHLDVHQQFLAYYEAAYIHTLAHDIQYNAVLDLLQKAYDRLGKENAAKEITEVEKTMELVRALHSLDSAYQGEDKN